MQKGFNSPRLLELKNKRKKALRNKALIILGMFFLLAVAFIFFSRWEEVNINTLDIQGNKILDDESIKKVVEEDLKGYYLWFIPKSNTFLYPRKKIENDLEDKFKRIEELNVDILNNRVLKISIKERKAVYTWCGENIEEFDVSGHLEVDKVNDVLEKCYFLNDEGYIFDKAPYFSGEVYFRFFGELSPVKDVSNPIGSYFEPEIFNKLIFLKDNILDVDLYTQAFAVKENGDMEFYLSSKNSLVNSPRVIFKRDADFVKIAENLQSAVKSEPLNTTLKEKYDSLNYIDLRFGNKIYYKFK
jgi:hypothetical protein